MKDLTEKQKQFIEQKQNEYHEFSLKNNLLENELAVLKIERDKKQEEYEEAKSELDSAKKIYSTNRCNFDNSKVEYVNKAEIRHVFLTLFKSFGVFSVISLISTLAGAIDILSFKDVLNYFLCTPLLGGSLSVIVANFFSDKTRRKFLNKFYNLEDSKKLLDDIEENKKVFSEKNIVFEEKKKALKECKYHIEQLEYRIRSNKCEMDNIKSSIFDVICSVDEDKIESDFVLNLKK